MKLIFKKILMYFLSIINILLIMKLILFFNTQSVDYVLYATCTLRRNSHETAISATAIRNFN
jgi:hypothetical protein